MDIRYSGICSLLNMLLSLIAFKIFEKLYFEEFKLPKILIL